MHVSISNAGMLYKCTHWLQINDLYVKDRPNNTKMLIVYRDLIDLRINYAHI